jgi:hypothetical protein
VSLVSFDDFFDALFVKFKTRCPDKSTQEVLQMLVGATFENEAVIIVEKMERVMQDLDFLYVNIQ